MPEAPLLTQEEAAARLNVRPSTVGTWLRAKKLRGTKIGRLWRIRPEDLQAFIDAEPESGGREK